MSALTADSVAGSVCRLPLGKGKSNREETANREDTFHLLRVAHSQTLQRQRCSDAGEAQAWGTDEEEVGLPVIYPPTRPGPHFSHVVCPSHPPVLSLTFKGADWL